MGMERYRKLFLDESLKHLQAVEEVMLGSEPLDRQALDSVFREVHSLKGMAASMGYASLADLAHRLEDRFDALRAVEDAVPEGTRELCLRVCDLLAEMRDDVAAGGEGALDWQDLLPELGPGTGRPAATASLTARVWLDPACESLAARAYLVLLRFREADPAVRSDPAEDEIVQGRSASQIDLFFSDLTREQVREVYDTLTEVVRLEFPEEEAGGSPEDAHSAGSGVVAGLPEGAPPAVGPPRNPPAQDPGARDGGRVRLPEVIQAPIQLLDEFVDLLGEMTTSRSHLESMARTLDSELLREEVDRLGTLVRSFHARVMALRMMPFSLITGSLKRLAREHSSKLGKEVELRVAGEEIGMDKSVLLQVSDPLLHLLRNALDHGLETPEERKQAGKPERGGIRIAATRARNRVEIMVSDDGRGIDSESVRRRAVELGLYRDEESRRLGNAELLSCLFRPGFTTRTEVSETSGRGVGLDVVKSRLDALGGTIEMVSSAGRGTEFRLSLPLSVAIVPVLMVAIGESVVAMPTSHISHTVEAAARDIREKDGAQVLLTEHGQVPIVSLAQVLQMRGKQKFERVPLVLVHTATGMAALAVDDFVGEEDLFIKPVRGPLRALKGLSGYSVRGDGRLVFLLDPPTLFGA